jgi:protein TonB
MRLGVIYVASVVFHLGLAAAVSAIDPPEVIETVRITLREPPPEVTEPEEPPPPPPEPEAPPPPPVAEAPPPPPRPRPEAPPPPVPQAPAPAPMLGVAMQGGVGLGGVAVPVGSTSAPAAPQVTRTATRTLEAAPEPQQRTSDGCDEEATRPRPLEMPQPAYTDEARTAAIEGRVRVRIEVDESGAVSNVEVLEGLGHGLDEAAVAAVRGARFEPSMRCGRAMAASFTIAVRFTL